MRARLRSIALDSGRPCLSTGGVHSKLTSGLSTVRGRLICTLCPVDLTNPPQSTSPASAVAHSRASGPPPVSSAQVVRAVEPARRHRPAVLVVEVALLRRRDRVLVPRVAPVDRVAERVVRRRTSPGPPSPGRTSCPSRIRMPRLISTRSLVTSLPSTTTPGVTNIFRPQSVMCRVVEVAVLGVVERAPAAQQHAAAADLLVAGQRLVDEVEQVVVHRHDALHELHVAHEPGVVVGEELDRRDACRPRPGRASTGGRGGPPSGRTSRACTG